MKSFVIHMSTSTARRDNADALCRDLPQGELIEAVDGRDPDQIGQIETHPGTLHRPHYPFALRPAEIGVFLSHRACWQRIVDEDLDMALIAEDDLAIDRTRFDRALQVIRAHATPDMHIRLPVKQAERAAAHLARDNGLELILPRHVGLQCICQVVGRRAAERLLTVSNQIDRPVDTLIQMHWLTNQPVHSLLGTGNREIAPQIGGSTIQKKIPPSQKLAREIRRSVYKAQVLMHPQRPS